MVRPAEDNRWSLFRTYRERYPHVAELEPLADLERSIRRRQARSDALSRRLSQLLAMVDEVRSELDAIDEEIVRTTQIGALLIDEVVDRLREETGEAWSPAPITGFRFWRIRDNRIWGNQTPWPSPSLEAECLSRVPGEDLPHPNASCGPPSCGIYAVKYLDMFGEGAVSGMIDACVLGVVAMSGKVIEHELGYRAAAARVRSLVAYGAGRHLFTDDPETIEELFSDPGGTLERRGEPGRPEPGAIRVFLETSRTKEEQWI